MARKGRKYNVHMPVGDRQLMGIELDVNDFITPAMAYYADKMPSLAERALRHTAYVIQEDMKQSLKHGRDGAGNNIPKLGGVQALRKLDRLRGEGRRKKKFAGDLKHKGQGLWKALGYKLYKGEGRVKVGWAHQKSFAKAAQFQRGKKTLISEDMKKYFAVMHRKGKTKRGSKFQLWPITAPVGTMIKSPPRPFIRPTMRAKKTMYGKIFAKRLARNIAEGSV